VTQIVEMQIDRPQAAREAAVSWPWVVHSGS
jgi:hypothetical protein